MEHHKYFLFCKHIFSPQDINLQRSRVDDINEMKLIQGRLLIKVNVLVRRDNDDNDS